METDYVAAYHQKGVAQPVFKGQQYSSLKTLRLNLLFRYVGEQAKKGVKGV